MKKLDVTTWHLSRKAISLMSLYCLTMVSNYSNDCNCIIFCHLRLWCLYAVMQLILVFKIFDSILILVLVYDFFLSMVHDSCSFNRSHELFLSYFSFLCFFPLEVHICWILVPLSMSVVPQTWVQNPSSPTYLSIFFFFFWWVIATNLH